MNNESALLNEVRKLEPELYGLRLQCGRFDHRGGWYRDVSLYLFRRSTVEIPQDFVERLTADDDKYEKLGTDAASME